MAKFLKRTTKTTVTEEYDIYPEDISTITLKGNRLEILRSDENEIFVVSNGTVLKWETALRKALETIANTPTLIVDDKHPSVCLKLSTSGTAMTDGDKRIICYALGVVGVKAVFCEI